MMLVYAAQVPGVDRDSPVPLPQQVAADLRARIKRDSLRRLPSLMQICQEYEVARPTAELAVKILADAGEVVVVPGRGTFVTRPQEDQ